MVTKIAYADWTRSGEYSRSLTQHAIRLVQRNMTPGGDKNGADINLALDALEMAFTHSHINAYVIVGGDSDFLSLVEKLKQYDKKVFVVGGRAFTSMILQRNCHEFIAYENLAGVRKAAAKQGRPMPAAAASAPIAQALPIVRRALKILADREVTPQTGLLKSTLLQLDSTFSERNYGASSFLDFVEKLAQAGFVQLKHVGPQRDGGAERKLRRRAARARGRRRKRRAASAGASGRRRVRPRCRTASRRRRRPARFAAAGFSQPHQEPAGPPLGDQADGVQQARTHSGRGHRRALADVSAQRQTDSAPDRRRLRRAPLRLRRADGSAEGVPARRASCASSAIAAAACACSRARRCRAQRRTRARIESAGRTCRSPTSKTRTRTSRSRRRRPCRSKPSRARPKRSRSRRSRSTRRRSCSGAPSRESRAPARSGRRWRPHRRRRPRKSRRPENRRAARSRRVAVDDAGNR